ncbi:MAG: hypothetical protein ACOH5I_21915 [Oligoflexus sp.]
MSVVTPAKVITDNATQEKQLFQDIQNGIKTKVALLPLLQDVSANYEQGKNGFRVYQWGKAGNVQAVPSDGTPATDGGMPLYSALIPNDQHNYNCLYVPYTADYISAVDYAEGFFQNAVDEHLFQMETDISAAMRTAAEDTVTCEDTDRAGTLNAAIGEKTMEALSIAFDMADLPKEGRVLIVNSKQKHELMRSFNLKDVSAAGDDSELRDARVGRLYGFDIIEGNSRILPVSDANQGLAFHRSAVWFGFAVPPTPVFAEKPDEFRDFFALRSLYGAKVNDLKNAAGEDQPRIWLIGKGASS